MPTVNLSPIGNDAPFLDSSGNPLSGGLLYTYTAGSSTPETTYTTSAGSVSNANPIVLNSGGYPASAGNVVSIWLTQGTSYKFVLKTSAAVEVWSRDNIYGINDPTNFSAAGDQWVASGHTPTYISATSFSVTGDQTGTYQANRRLKTTNTGGTIYSRIKSSTFGAVTTVTVVNDSGTLDSGLSAVSLGVVTPINGSVPVLIDTYPVVSGSSDKTKLLRIEVDGFTTDTTRVATMPDKDGTVAMLGDTIVVAQGLNIGGTVTLAANALTFALKGADGNNPSAGNPVDIYFQSATVTTGTLAKRSFTAASSITIPSTATVGTRSAVPSRIYIGVLDNAGTPELCYWNPSTTAAHPAFAADTGYLLSTFRPGPAAVYSTTANTTASDSAGVIYSDSARSNVRVTPIAYIDSRQTTAGTWAVAITSLVIIGPKTPITGDLIKETIDVDAALATGTAVIPMDDTIPDPNTAEGDQYLNTGAVNYTSASNVFEVEAQANFASSVASDGFAGYLVWANAGATLAAQVVSGNVVAAGDQVMFNAKLVMQGNDQGVVNAVLYVGSGAAGTTTFNGRAGGRLYGGIMSGRLSLKEIAA